MSDLASVQLRYRQLLVEAKMLEKELVQVDLAYEEAHDNRERVKHKVEFHYEKITEFVDTVLGAHTSERLKLRLVFDGILDVDNVSIAGIKPGGNNERRRSKIIRLDRETP